MQLSIKRFKSIAKDSLVIAAYVAFMVKALVPVGYMPGALANGSPVMLCDGVYGTSLLIPGAHHPSSDKQKGKTKTDQWKHCPLGALAGAASLTSDRPRQFWPQAEKDVFVPVATPQRMVPRRPGFHSRAPPSEADV